MLVVDDDPDSSRVVEMLLTACGQNVRVAADGRGALALIGVFEPELVLLDIGMPDMDGLEVAREIRRLERIEQPAIVAMTGHGQTADRIATREAGFNAHLVKPVTYERLARVLVDSTAPAPPRPSPGEACPLLRGSTTL